MASIAVNKSKTATLSGTTVDTLTFSQLWDGVEVVNLNGTSGVAFTLDGTTPAVDGDDVYMVDPGGSLKLDTNATVTGNSMVLKIIGSGNKYRVTGLVRYQEGMV